MNNLRSLAVILCIGLLASPAMSGSKIDGGILCDL